MRNQLKLPTRLVEKNRPRNAEPPPLQEITPSSGWTEDSNCHYLFLELPNFKQEEIKMQIEGPDRVKVSGERKAGKNKVYFDKTYTVPDNTDTERIGVKLEGDTFTVTITKRLPPPPPPPWVQEPVQEITSENKSTDKEFEEIANTLPDTRDSKKGNVSELDEKLKDQEDTQPDIGDSKKESDHHGSEDEKLKEEEEKEHQKEEIDYSSKSNHQFSSTAAKMICDSKSTIFMTLIAFCLGVLVSRKI